MTPTRPATSRAATALRLAAALPLILAATAASAQSTITAKPLSDDDCSQLAKETSDRTGVPVDVVVGDAGPYIFTNLDGTACLFSGTATGVSKNLENLATIGEGFEGWTRDSAYDADAPGATSVTFTRGNDWFALSVGAEPPTDTCEDVMISECKAPLSEWTWTVSGMAFTAPAGVRPEY
ncbi:hypothetical protein [Amorphus orientalis]|uniref:Uncharacterized protein n=1 Tax=Amorphus orientalis TaxID=649198 RepID=A0AAE3VLD5_9HYPH|nr:hypothetical protein [Amorphus orientalis]MDQ0314649.1 hypothetical protein [Amorphus orientalis]